MLVQFQLRHRKTQCVRIKELLNSFYCRYKQLQNNVLSASQKLPIDVCAGRAWLGAAGLDNYYSKQIDSTVISALHCD